MNIWWIRRDVRITDNQALAAALKTSDAVLPLFILDEKLLARKADNRQNFLFSGLRELDRELKKMGSKLILRRGDPLIELPRVADECEIHSVYAEEDITPYAVQRDAAIAKHLELHLEKGVSVYPISSITRLDGTPYTIFTPYSRTWQTRPWREQIIPKPDTLPTLPNVSSVPLPEIIDNPYFPAGESEAKHRLARFMGGTIHEYEHSRDRLDIDGTSLLSPYLRFGMLSINEMVIATRQAEREASDEQSRENCMAWLRQLIWHEFYQSILFHFPKVLKTSFKSRMSKIPWRNSPQDLHAWQAGLTGYPVVDAGMRQLAATGWMHNRARMITASFLVKDLLINWQEGEAWFMRMLIDGDPAANNGGWQWVAGTGTDAAPYFRIFNPVRQGKKFDPEGVYVRRWVPELANLPVKYIHTPWEMPLSEQQQYNVLIGRDYPEPIVEHQLARQRALDGYSNR